MTTTSLDSWVRAGLSVLCRLPISVCVAQPHVVTILSDSASRTEDLDESEVLKAKEEAERAFHDRDGEIDFEHAQQQMVEARAKYEALQKLRGRTGRS